MFERVFTYCRVLLTAALVTLPAVASADFTGRWTGSWNSVYGTSGALDVTMTQTSSTIGGKLSIFSTDCGNLIDLALSGTAFGNSASFSASVFCDGSYNTLNFTNGNLSGDTINGNYNVLADGEYYDSGGYTLIRDCCTISATAGLGGTIAPPGVINTIPGLDVSFVIAANNGYTISDVLVDGDSQGAISSHTFFNVTSDHTISAIFTKQRSGFLPFLNLLSDEK